MKRLICPVDSMLDYGEIRPGKDQRFQASGKGIRNETTSLNLTLTIDVKNVFTSVTVFIKKQFFMFLFLSQHFIHL